MERRARLLAYYLPQFHPIPENDIWWGAGFTEWTNVARATPLFKGHWQPRLPADLGFYDLRVPETRELQAEFASNAGIEGFVYWHYWFGNGRRLLERPFSEVVSSGKPVFPFCLAWANSSWSGIWHGNPDRTLVEQLYPGKEDEREHFVTMLPAFRDSRYVKIAGRLVFMVLMPDSLPDPAAFIAHWRKLAVEFGIPDFHFIAMSNKMVGPILDFFDGVTNFNPGELLDHYPQTRLGRLKHRIRTRNFHFGKPRRFNYDEVIEQALTTLLDDERHYPCVIPNWDNTPRSKKNGVVFEGTTPETFGLYLDKALARVASRPAEQRIVFLKAWNEWAEGNYVEPDAKYGHAWLETIRSRMLR